MSKIPKQRPYTKIGLLLALIVGVGVSTLLITVEGNILERWPDWFATNHWLMTAVRVGLFGAGVAVFYLVRKRSLGTGTVGAPSAHLEELRVQLRQLTLWFVGIELLFGQALLPHTLEYFFA